MSGGIGGVILGWFISTAFGGDGSSGINWIRWLVAILVAAVLAFRRRNSRDDALMARGGPHLTYASIFNKLVSPVMSKRRKTSGWRVLIVS